MRIAQPEESAGKAASPLLDHYRGLESACRQMLDAARQARWDDVALLERANASMIAELKSAARHHRLSAADHGERMRILHRIVMVDAEIRYLAQPWLASLDRMLGRRASLTAKTTEPCSD